MDMSRLKLFAMVKQKMAHASVRQRVLAQNIAHANTPDYQPRDVKPLDFKSMLGAQAGVRMATTNPAHMPAMAGAADEFRTGEDRFTVETAPDGNAVSLEQQMVKVSQNGNDFQLAADLYAKNVRMLKLVVRGNNN
jgi:flagellar basal-body rod protein FlgB